MTQVIGRGLFQWDSIERQTDRYGSFTLSAHDEDSNIIESSGKKITHSDWTADDKKAYLDKPRLTGFVGKYVVLTATVIETRVSRHIGDMTRKLQPTRPEVGEIIEIGRGELFLEPSRWADGECCGDVYIGLLPDDGRDRAWLDPVKLFRLHTQTVEITVEECEMPTNRVPPKPMDLSDVTLSLEPTGGGFMQIKRL